MSKTDISRIYFETLPRDIHLHLLLNSSCNGKCKFCTVKDIRPSLHLDDKLLYEYLLSLYPHVSYLIPTMGEVTIHKRNLEYLNYIHENYPQITLCMESNGIQFKDKWLELYLNNRSLVKLSINAIKPDEYAMNVWSGKGGETAFNKILKNIDAMINCLDDRYEILPPSLYFVITPQNVNSIEEYVRFCLERKILCAGFYFENFCYDRYNNGALFSDLKMFAGISALFELKYILSGRLEISFNLFRPYNVFQSLKEKTVYNTLKDPEYLKNRYRDLLDMVPPDHVASALYKHNRIRMAMGKSELSIHDISEFNCWDRLDKEDYSVCINPWKHILLGLSIDRELEVRICPFIDNCYIKTKDIIRNGSIDWLSDVFNSDMYVNARKNFLKGIYPQNCMYACPASLNI